MKFKLYEFQTVCYEYSTSEEAEEHAKIMKRDWYVGDKKLHLGTYRIIYTSKWR